MTGLPILSLAILLPLLGAILLLFINNRDGSKDALIRNITLGVSLITFAVTLALWAGFHPSGESFQFVERHPWIPAFGIEYYLGIDGLSLMLIVLTGFLTPIALLTSWESIETKVKEFSIFMLVLETAMIGVFCALDLFLFYLFWDILLIPMYFLIGIWGYDQRVYAAAKFILYTLAGSVLMLVAIIGLSWMHQAATGQYSFDLMKLYALEIPFSTQGLWKGIDVLVVDGAVNGAGYVVGAFSAGLRLLQTGSVKSYAAGTLFGAVAILAYYLWR